MSVSNVSRAILYALSEMGEVGTVSADNTVLHGHSVAILRA